LSVRNYHAWIRAARKASKKTGGLSLPAARKAYKKMADRVGRPLKGTDVQRHPRIFRESIPGSAGGFKRRAASVRSANAKVKKAPAKPPVAPGPMVAKRRIRTLKEFERWLDDRARQGLGLPNASEDMEYVSTAEYRKK